MDVNKSFVALMDLGFTQILEIIAEFWEYKYYDCTTQEGNMRNEKWKKNKILNLKYSRTTATAEEKKGLAKAYCNYLKKDNAK